MPALKKTPAHGYAARVCSRALGGTAVPRPPPVGRGVYAPSG